MKQAVAMACLSVGVLGSATANAFASVVTFDAVPVGTMYGGGASVPDTRGEVVHSEEQIDMSVEEFLLRSFVGFDLETADVIGAQPAFFDTNALALDNISVRFDFSRLTFDVTQVTVGFFELGGENNFSVNRISVLTPLANIADLDGMVLAPNITASVDTNNGLLTLTAQGGATISSFLIGGQELMIDTIVVVPEPATLVLIGAGGLLLIRRRRPADPDRM